MSLKNSKTGWRIHDSIPCATARHNNNGTLPGDWKRATVVPIHKGVIDLSYEL